METITEDFVSYELAQVLKSSGFDWRCEYCYIVNKHTKIVAYQEYAGASDWNHAEIGGPKYQYTHISAPTLWQAHKWLREVKGIAINVMANGKGEYCQTRAYLPNYAGRTIGYDWAINGVYPLYNTYEEALSTGISKALESPTQNTQ